LRSSLPATISVGQLIAETLPSRSRPAIIFYMEAWKFRVLRQQAGGCPVHHASGRRSRKEGGYQRSWDSCAILPIPCVRATPARSRKAPRTKSGNVHRVATSVSDCTRSGRRSANACAILPPTEMPSQLRGSDRPLREQARHQQHRSSNRSWAGWARTVPKRSHGPSLHRRRRGRRIFAPSSWPTTQRGVGTIARRHAAYGRQRARKRSFNLRCCLLEDFPHKLNVSLNVSAFVKLRRRR